MTLDPRDRVTDLAFRLAPELLDAELATPWRRMAALSLDLVFASVIRAMGPSAIGAALAAGLVYRLITRLGRRWGGRALKPLGVLAAVSVFALGLQTFESQDNGGHDSTKAEAIDALEAIAQDLGEGAPKETDTDDQTAAAEDSPGEKAELNFGGVSVPLGELVEAAKSGLEKIDTSLIDELNKQNQRLERENEELRSQVEDPSFLRMVRAAAGDVGLTLGWVGAYFTLLMAWSRGYTPAKRLLGIRVYRLDGGVLNLWWSFERFGGYAAGLATGLLGFAQVFWDPNRQSIQDRIAGTVVVRMRTRNTPRYIEVPLLSPTSSSEVQAS